jgi:hypothetical protein
LQLHHNANTSLCFVFCFCSRVLDHCLITGGAEPTFGTRAEVPAWSVMADGSRSPSDGERRGRSRSRRPQGERAGGERVIERVVEKVAPTGPANYPILMKTNYNEWSLLMKIKLEARSLWAAVDKGDAEFQVDRMALDAICSAVPPDMIATLAVKPTAKEVWDCIKTMRIGDDRVRKATLQKV